jgi:hypothetical protein
MHKINLITPPDKLFNNNFSFLLIYPSNSIRDQFQNAIATVDYPFNVYFYEADSLSHDADWLLSVAKIVDVVILDIDNCEPEVKNLASYFIANPNTYWLTNDSKSFYNKLSVNKVYNLDFIQKIIGDYIETQV